MLCFDNDRRDSRRDGFTLLEVVVGLVLMATLLVAIVQATAVHKQNLRRASDKLAAVEVADALLTDLTRTDETWWPASGPVANHPTWQWISEPAAAAAPLGVPVQVVRLRIVDATAAGPIELVRVEVVEPLREVRR